MKCPWQNVQGKIVRIPTNTLIKTTQTDRNTTAIAHRDNVRHIKTSKIAHAASRIDDKFGVFTMSVATNSSRRRYTRLAVYDNDPSRPRRVAIEQHMRRYRQEEWQLLRQHAARWRCVCSHPWRHRLAALSLVNLDFDHIGHAPVEHL